MTMFRRNVFYSGRWVSIGANVVYFSKSLFCSLNNLFQCVHYYCLQLSIVSQCKATRLRTIVVFLISPTRETNRFLVLSNYFAIWTRRMTSVFFCANFFFFIRLVLTTFCVVFKSRAVWRLFQFRRQQCSCFIVVLCRRQIHASSSLLFQKTQKNTSI